MRVVLSNHAVARYAERVKPNLLDTAAEREIRSLTEQGELRAELNWRHGNECDAYLVLSDGVALTLKHAGNHWLATSCLIRSGISPEKRAHRKERRHSRQRGKAFSRRYGTSRSAEWWAETFGQEAA